MKRGALVCSKTSVAQGEMLTVLKGVGHLFMLERGFTHLEMSQKVQRQGRSCAPQVRTARMESEFLVKLQGMVQ